MVKVALRLSKLGKSAKKAKITFGSLNKWNRNLAVVHFAQGVAILFLSGNSGFAVTTNFLAIDTLATKGAGHVVLAQANRHLFDVNLAYLVAAFFFMSAIAHLVVATVYRQNYEKNLKKGINKVRWWEYGFSASTMMVAIALLTGISDLSLLVAIFALDFIMNMCGLIMEVHNQGVKPGKQVNWLSYWIGSLAGIVPWIAILIYMLGAGMYGSGIPTFVYWIYVSMFVFFSSFALNMYLQYRGKGRWANYLYGERVYMILSLVAKTLLAWQVFFGTLRP
jgi:hypothetical protein